MNPHSAASFVDVAHAPGSAGAPDDRATRHSEYGVTTSVIHHLDALLASDIDALARTAIEPNVFLESWMLGPILEHVEAVAPCVVLIRHRDGCLTGLFVLQPQRRYRGFPVRSLRSWQHDYLFLGSPLIARDHVEGTLGALFNWLASDSAPAPILELISARADGPFAEALRNEVTRRPRFAMHSSLRQRALLDLRTAEEPGGSGKHRKELRRQERRLAELGHLGYRTLAATEDAEAWIDRFLALEAKGWKGLDGTAMAANAGSRRFFASAASEAHRRGQLQMLEMTLDDNVIATKCNFISGEGAFMFKIAYDENYAKYSPGMLLELFNMQALEASPGALTWVDSCAKSEHFMIERLWSGRRTLGDYSICGRGVIARALIRHGERIRTIRRRIRRYLARPTP